MKLNIWDYIMMFWVFVCLITIPIAIIDGRSVVGGIICLAYVVVYFISRKLGIKYKEEEEKENNDLI